jgi:hypothetical protein
VTLVGPHPKAGELVDVPKPVNLASITGISVAQPLRAELHQDGIFPCDLEVAVVSTWLGGCNEKDLFFPHGLKKSLVGSPVMVVHN